MDLHESGVAVRPRVDRGGQSRRRAAEALHDFSGPVLAVASSPDGTETAEVQRSAIPALLAQRFGLPGFGLGSDGRVVGLG